MIYIMEQCPYYAISNKEIHCYYRSYHGLRETKLEQIPLNVLLVDNILEDILTVLLLDHAIETLVTQEVMNLRRIIQEGGVDMRMKKSTTVVNLTHTRHRDMLLDIDHNAMNTETMRKIHIIIEERVFPDFVTPRQSSVLAQLST